MAPTDQIQPTQRTDDLVLLIVLTVCFITPIALTIWWTVEDRLFPPMLISILLGIAVATLTYRYLGGTAGSEIQVGTLKVVGSAAMLLGTALVTNHYLSAQMTDENKPRTVSRLIKEIESLEALKKELLAEKSSLLAKLEILEKDSAIGFIERFSSLNPESFEFKKILEMSEKREGPYREVTRTFETSVTSVIKPKAREDFFACDSLKLSQARIRISRTIEDGNESNLAAIELKYSGRIDDAQCKQANPKFSIQISCAAGLELFPDHIKKCNPDGSVGWGSSERNFSVTISVLNGKA